MKTLIQYFLNWVALKMRPKNNEAFFKGVSSLFPKLSTKQKEGMEALLKATSNLPLSQRAYLLATAYHETATTMQPIHEYGGVKMLSDGFQNLKPIQFRQHDIKYDGIKWLI